jgi:hypothetical protein
VPEMDDEAHDETSRSDGFDEVLDVFVFAPIGAFLHGPETVGDLATKGRQDVANARFIGRAVLRRGLGEGREQVGATVEALARRGGDVLVAVARAAGAPFAEPSEDVTPDDTPAATRLRVVESDEERVSEPVGPDVDSLAIPGYDTLAASQVVPRLDDLADDELAAVQDYERGHRGRMTILSRIAQLRAS